MNKYIDSEKLIAEIERFSSVEYSDKTLDDDVANGALDYVLEEIIPSLQQEQPVPDSTKLIEFWNEDKEMLKEKSFSDDPWRLAYNAFMCGFGRGIAVKKQEQPLTTEKVVEQCKRFGGNPEVIQPEVDLELEIERIVKDEEEFMKFQVRHQLIGYVARHFYKLGLNAKKK